MSQETSSVNKVLFIATVGGSPEPVVAALKHWRPDRIVFIVSPETYFHVGQIVALSSAEGFVVSEGSYDLTKLEDAQDFGACVHALKGLDVEVAKWLERSRDHRVVVDLTAGTKAMSSALAVVARRWPCIFSYVAGLERTKGGVGVVVSGTERVVHTANPWDVLGYQAIEDACLAFDTGSYAVAKEYLDTARRRTEDDRIKRELSAVAQVVEGYDAWDRFKHREAFVALKKARSFGNDLVSALGPFVGRRLLSDIDRHLEHLREIDDAGPGRALLLDLLANARRRSAEGRFEDAVARLYRATEAAGQLKLRDAHGIKSTSKVKYSSVPESLAERWKSEGRKEPLKLALSQVYMLLSELGDELGRRFFELGFAGEDSPLSARNMSILAHGFDPVGEAVFPRLWNGVLQLIGVAEGELPEFPSLSLVSPVRSNQR
ncbi:MAG TPA: TIGR02710 family CRISPR-associated CARF protein [Longimicrobiales bacterium]|nr:TIGR02710 family CRISPR-associated CARF protein [Longimicrobiales bacterium]